MDRPAPAGAGDFRARLDALYRAESRRVLATLVRLLGDLDLAEEALQEAFAAAVRRWPEEGWPDQPRAWLVSTGRFRLIDVLRRRARGRELLERWVAGESVDAAPETVEDDDAMDDRLRLLFVCCHPALPPEGRVALTLREVCGLRTEEVARAFLVPAPTIAQRIVRAKARIAERRLPFELPAPSELPARLEDVRRVIYLLFNEGYSASAGPDVLRSALSGEAIRLARLVAARWPEAENLGLLALLLFQESRRAARVAADGAIVLLPEQDRALWDRALIAEADGRLRAAFAGGEVGPYALQAAIAGEHARAATAAATNWRRIVAFYDLLRRAEDTPVVALNRAVALGEAEGPEAALAEVERLLAGPELATHHLAHAVHGEFLRRLRRPGEARAALERARSLATQEPERRLLERRLAALGPG